MCLITSSDVAIYVDQHSLPVLNWNNQSGKGDERMKRYEICFKSSVPLNNSGVRVNLSRGHHNRTDTYRFESGSVR